MTPLPQRRAAFREQIIDAFDLGELEEACYDLDVEFESLSGSNLNLKVIAFIEYLERRDKLGDFVDYAHRKRPMFNWAINVDRVTGEQAHASRLLQPFGELSCEEDITTLGVDGYRSYYFDETPFGERALSQDCYLIIGRRGSGKTALAQSFKFQRMYRNAAVVDVHAGDSFETMRTEAAQLRVSENLCK
jgi:predicted NACHT family NTPase